MTEIPDALCHLLFHSARRLAEGTAITHSPRELNSYVTAKAIDSPKPALYNMIVNRAS